MSLDPRTERRYLPPIFDLARLFPGLRYVARGTSTTYRELAGFPVGSRILITGEAGSGKTTFALGLVRALMVQWSPMFNARARRAGASESATAPDIDRSVHFGPARSVGDDGYKATEHELCFLSTEMDVDRLEHLFSQYGWFTPTDPLFQPLKVGATAKGPTCFVPRISEAKIRLPPHGAGDLVDLVLKEVKDSYGRRPPGHDVLVVVDSLTAILKDSRDAGERRRDLQQFLERLEDALRPSRPALMFLIAERSGLPDPVTFADEVAADFVFRLGLSKTSPGRWLRTFTVAKSAGVHMTVGEHTWAVLTKVGMQDVIAQPRVAKWIQDTSEPSAAAASKNWATIAVFPKPQLAPIGSLNKKATDPDQATPRVKSGIRGLDELLSGHVPYWITKTPRGGGALIRGTTTLLVGTAGSGKTTMCLQFLAAEERDARTLYVNFETRPDDIQKLYNTRSPRFRELFENWNTLYRRRGNLDVNLLLAELRFVIERANVQRIALDGLSDLLATTQRDDYARLVEAVLGTIRDVNRNALTFVAFEFDPARLEWQFPTAEGLSATADNVVVLRRILINDEFRRTAYVLKARGMSPDAQVREVHISDDPNRSPLSIASGLESHSNLLSGKPEPVAIYLQLFSENSAEENVNVALKTRLERLFGHNVQTFGFSRPAIARTLDDLVSPSGRIPHSDVKVVSLDEWWVREYGVPGQRAPTEGTRVGTTQHPLLELDSLFRRPVSEEREGHLDLNEYRASPAQFWVFEVEKASEGGQEGVSKLRAVPNYTDFGMFCVNRSLWSRLPTASREKPRTKKQAKDLKTVWQHLLRELPRAWVRRYAEQPFGFAKPEPHPDHRTVIVDWMAAARDLPEQPSDGFCFDMETSETTVCFYLELCWAFGASEDFLIRDVARGQRLDDPWLDNHAATHAMRLLQYLVFHKLMSPSPSLRKSDAAFSRHWYSTITEWQDNARKSGTDMEQAPFPLPFFPTGFNDDLKAGRGVTDSLKEAYSDIFIRFERLLRRVDAALRYRGGDYAQVSSLLTKLKPLRPPDSLDWAAFRPNLDEFRRLAIALRDVALRSPTLARGRIPAETPVAALTQNREARQFVPAARTLNLRDVLELLRWHDLRVGILDSELKRQPLHQAVFVGDRVAPLNTRVRGVTALTGYCCSGSWMLGVGRRTHNPLLSWKLMEEMTSFDASVERSEAGAGVPVRKDFYDVFGEKSVKHVEHLTWNDLLLFGGARARRRDRTLCPGIKAAPVFDTISRQVLQCLTLAKSWRDMKEAGQKLNLKTMNGSATEAVREIFKGAVTAMKAMNGRCASCTYAGCEALWSRRDGVAN
jgi:KaiC/GvpD/RAD55 family RecA-like ATPase